MFSRFCLDILSIRVVCVLRQIDDDSGQLLQLDIIREGQGPRGRGKSITKRIDVLWGRMRVCSWTTKEEEHKQNDRLDETLI